MTSRTNKLYPFGPPRPSKSRNMPVFVMKPPQPAQVFQTVTIEWTPIPSACAAGERPIWRHPPSHSIDCEAFSRKRQPLHTRSRKHNETDHPSIPLFSSSLIVSSPSPLPISLTNAHSSKRPSSHDGGNAPPNLLFKSRPSSCAALTVPNAARHSLPFDNEISTFPRSFVLLSSFPCLSSERFEVLWIS